MTRDEVLRRAGVAYRRRFRSEPERISWAPGRVEVLGNHTDYNDGFVLSAALDLGIAAAAGRLEERRIALWSEAFEHLVESALDDPRLPEGGSWAAYPLGVLRELDGSGSLPGGLRLAIESSLPVGSGLSSSAALELATAEAAFAIFGGRPEDPMDIARACRKAEVEFVGVPCGILDQFSSLFGKSGHLLFLDCRTLGHERLPLGRADLRLVIADSGVRHALVDGRYAELRERCESAARTLEDILGRPVPRLRDVTLEEFLEVADRLAAGDRRRAEHVLRENERVLRGRDALRAGDVAELGRLMLASHASSRDLFGNSCAELDELVKEASETDGFLGGKLSGGGFGGSTVNLVEARQAERFAHRLEERYRRRFGRVLRTIITGAGEGASVA